MPEDWRKDIKVHPAAAIFPMMGDYELDALAADIAQHGLQQKPTWIDDPVEGLLLLDGRNRIEAIHRIPDTATRGRWKDLLRLKAFQAILPTGTDPVAYVVGANVRRRHLTADQKREL